MSETRRALGCLGSAINVAGEEAVNNTVGPERTAVERHTMEMYARREETWRPLNNHRVAAFVKLFLLCVVYRENGDRRGRPHPVTARLLKKALVKRVIPFIHRRLVWTMDDTFWIITMEHFRELNDYLATHLPKIHAGHHWDMIHYFFKEVKKQQQEEKRQQEEEERQDE